ncbi:MAG: ATP-binding cassette domain-containing protein [Actinomycetota bacterium]|nr:ATP-binding cassette domain-containing protein [Actinomycetota bacterium]
MTQPVLSLEKVTKRFAVGNDQELTAVNRVSFDIAPGSTLALVGESGSGKTTVGRCILRTLEPTEGSIVFEGTDISRLSAGRLRPLRPKLQAVFQDPTDSLNPRMRVASLVDEPLRTNTRLSESERRSKCIRFLEMVGLGEETLRLYPHNLTAGEQQRVAIARALILEPSMLVLDEPTSSLDPIAREEILALLRRLQLELGTSFLFISHDLVSVRHISHRIAVMYLGEIVEEGPVEQVFEDPRHPYTRALLAAAPSVDRSIDEDRLVLSGEIPSPIDLPQGCFLASRCPFVTDECRAEHPELRDAGERRARCLRLTADLGIPADMAEPIVPTDFEPATKSRP